jgi:hypothetical protein
VPTCEAKPKSTRSLRASSTLDVVLNHRMAGFRGKGWPPSRGARYRSPGFISARGSTFRNLIRLPGMGTHLPGEISEPDRAIPARPSSTRCSSSPSRTLTVPTPDQPILNFDHPFGVMRPRRVEAQNCVAWTYALLGWSAVRRVAGQEATIRPHLPVDASSGRSDPKGSRPMTTLAVAMQYRSDNAPKDRH